MGMTFYTRGLALDSRHPRFIPLRIADRRPRLVANDAPSGGTLSSRYLHEATVHDELASGV